MKISVLINTYNRAALLEQALASVLRQRTDGFALDVVVIDDCSSDDTRDRMERVDDPRVHYTRNAVNVGANHGDMALLRRFVDECQADAFLYLCDDDYLIPDDLLSRQATALKADDGLAFVQGGMAQCFPSPVVDLVPNVDYLQYEFLDEDRRQIFGRGMLPTHAMSGKEYLTLLAADPKNRNIITGATLYRTETFKKAGALNRLDGVRWQGGYALFAGATVFGGVLYFDEPCVMTEVESSSASYRGTQRMHMLDALASVDAALGPVLADPDYRAIRDRMAKQVLMTYVCNKIGHALGWFSTNALGDISAHFVPPIPGGEFLHIAHDRDIPLSRANERLIRLSDGPVDKRQWPVMLEMAA